MKRNRAFTLIELLVVIGIIAVLLAILLPSMSMARKRTRTAVCLANVRALDTAGQGYLMDWGRMFPFVAGTSVWPQALAGAALLDADPDTGAGQGSLEKMRMCPEAMEPSAWKMGSVAVGAAHTYWSSYSAKGVETRSSYGLNGWMYDAVKTQGADLTDLRNASNTKFAPDYMDYFCRWPVLTNRGPRVPMFADGCWAYSFPRQTDSGPLNVEEPSTITVTIGTNTMSRFVMNRHSMAVNVGFLDGHAETVKLRDMWTLQWTENWTRTNPESRF